MLFLFADKLVWSGQNTKLSFKHDFFQCFKKIKRLPFLSEENVFFFSFHPALPPLAPIFFAINQLEKTLFTKFKRKKKSEMKRFLYSGSISHHMNKKIQRKKMSFCGFYVFFSVRNTQNKNKEHKYFLLCVCVCVW